MTRIDIPKTTNEEQTNGCWWFIQPGDPVPVMRCPECDRIAGLNDHQIDRNGIVKPSVVCTRKGCSFHREVRLLDWDRT